MNSSLPTDPPEAHEPAAGRLAAQYAEEIADPVLYRDLPLLVIYKL
jgi:hypothetical protein